MCDYDGDLRRKPDVYQNTHVFRKWLKVKSIYHRNNMSYFAPKYISEKYLQLLIDKYYFCAKVIHKGVLDIY